MPYQIRVRRDVLNTWNTNDPILGEGEIGFATDTKEIRIGDGVSVWTELTPIQASGDAISIDGKPIEAGPPQNGEVLQYNNVTDEWEYTTLSGLGGNTLSTDTLWNAKGDLVVGTGDNQATILPVGATNGHVLKVDSSTATGLAWGAASGSGTVTSVSLTMPSSIFDVAGSPIDSSGTLAVTLDNQNGNTVFAGPTSNSLSAPPTFRNLVAADIPNISTEAGPIGAALASITSATNEVGSGADQMLYLSGAKSFARTTLTSTARTLLADTSTTAMRSTLGLGTIATQPASNVSITGGSLSGVLVATGTYNSPVNEAQLIKARKSNATNSPITKGEVVYIVGSTGSHMTVERARADVEATSAYTIGIAATDISDTADGYIMQNGRLTGLSTLTTATYADGDTLYLSESTAGGYRKTLPTAPNHGVFLGFVIKANTGNAGEMDVRISNYQEVSELSDVLITSINDGHMLVWDNTDLRWENKTPNQVLTNIGAAAAADLADYSPTTHGHGNITGGGAIGSTSGMLVKTTTSGVLTTQTKGTGSQYLKMNSGGTDVEFGTIAIGELPTGTTSTTVALGNHTHGLTTNGDILYHDGTGLARLPRGTDGQVLKSTTTSIAWGTDNTGSGSGTPGGNTTEVQYNNSGAFAGSSNFTWTNGSSLLTVNGNIQLSAQGDLRFADANSSNYVAFQAPATVSTDVTWTLPAADGSANQVLSTDGSGTLAWLKQGNGLGVTATFGTNNSTTPALWTPIRYTTTTSNITVPAGATIVEVVGSGGGGGGGGGSMAPASGDVRAGGSGGAGGAGWRNVFLLSDFGSPSAVTVTIGAGGTAGTGAATGATATAGGAGGAGGATTLTVTSGGALMVSYPGGAGGVGGPTGSQGAATAATTFVFNGGGGGRGGRSAATGTAGSNNLFGGGGGGGGGGATTTNNDTNSGEGGASGIWDNAVLTVATNADGTARPTAVATNGNPGSAGSGYYGGDGGSGGNGDRSGNATNGGTGGAGGAGGGGGGGGGGKSGYTTVDGTRAGNGGVGGDGYMVLRFW